MDGVGFEVPDGAAQTDGGVPEVVVSQETALEASVLFACEDDAVGGSGEGGLVSACYAALVVPDAEFRWGNDVGFAEDPFGDEEAPCSWRAASDSEKEWDQCCPVVYLSELDRVLVLEDVPYLLYHVSEFECLNDFYGVEVRVFHPHTAITKNLGFNFLEKRLHDF